MSAVRELRIRVSDQGMHEITDQVQSVVSRESRGDGLCTVFIRHTSASLMIQENADPSAVSDLERWLDRLVPEGATEPLVGIRLQQPYKLRPGFEAGRPFGRRQVFEDRQGLGRIEIVLERCDERWGDLSRFDAVGDSVPAVEALLLFAHQLVAEIQGLAVMGRKQRQAQRLAAMRLQQFVDGLDVAAGLGHLLAAHIKIAVVHPVTHKGLAVGAFALGDLVFMVGKHQVLAATVNIDRRPQTFLDHARAFKMPARPPPPPGTVPARLIVSGGFPQHKIGRILFIGRHFDPRPVDHLFAVAA